MDKVLSLVPSGRWFDRPVPERHRLIFYAGHVEAFDWNLIRRHLDLPDQESSFDRLFAFGIDPSDSHVPEDVPSDWPSRDEVLGYSAAVRRRIDAVAHRVSPSVLHIALEHRLMHVETFAYLLHNLSAAIDPRCPVLPSPFSPKLTQDDRLMTIPAGCATLGRQRIESDNPGSGVNAFGWDNEFDAHRVWVPSFAINQYKVTNRRYLAFVEAGAPPPHFWRRSSEHGWRWRTLAGDIALPLDWPVYVTHTEATAYARWSGQHLPSEAEFHRAAYGTFAEEERSYPWGDGVPSPAYGNFDGQQRDPVGVASTPAGDSAFGVAQLVGNGWEWTSTVFSPFPGFRAHPCYPGYSSPFFDGDHYVLKGGSPVTAAPFLRRSFRNWFRGSYPYVYATFRCIER